MKNKKNKKYSTQGGDEECTENVSRKTQERRLLKRTKRRWENDIKMVKAKKSTSVLFQAMKASLLRKKSWH
jgi:hypothetical protein